MNNDINIVTSIDFVMVFDLLIFLSIAYLWSSGEQYMVKAANDSGRSGKLDRVMLGIIGSASLYGAFIRETWIPYAQIAPLFVHLLQIAYLSAVFKHSKEPYRKKWIGRLIAFFTHNKIIHN